MPIDPQGLREGVAELVALHHLNGIRLAVSDHGTRHFLAGTPDDLIEAGCLAKLLTSSLLAEAVRDGLIAWDDQVTDLAAAPGGSDGDAAPVTPRQLANHAHGLEMDREVQPGVRRDGRVDWDELRGNLRTAAYRSCGSYYSYDHIGTWCLAAILERLHACRFIEVLRARGFERYAQVSATTTVQSVCASSGGQLELRMDEWLSFAEYGISLSHDACFPDRPAFPLPGWHPTEKGIRLGWKSYGDDWFGHYSNMPETTTFMRVSPSRKCALVLSAPGRFAAYFALAKLFGWLLPEFSGTRAPRLRREVLSADEARRFAGTYRRLHNRVEIASDRSGALELVVQDGPGNSARYRLRAAECGLFVVERGAGTEFNFVQVLDPATGGDQRLLWNGRRLWSRAA